MSGARAARTGSWGLAPAYDVTWVWKPGNAWLDSHQMSINGRRDGFTLADLHEVARVGSLKQGRAEAILAEVVEAVRGWSEIAAQTRVDETLADQIARSHRLALPRG